MAVSKRLRYEVLRRDNHTCRYCGATAPDATLTIDHVTPVALGGSDDPGNLVAACRDCNAGKSSASADSALIADVSQDALRWAAAMQRAVNKRLEALKLETNYLAQFLDKWNGYTFVSSKKTVALPDDWERSLVRWYGMGVPIEIVNNAVDRAMTKRRVSGYDAEFRYMAGVVWGVVREMQDDAAADLAAEDHPEPVAGVHRCYVPAPDEHLAILNFFELARVCDRGGE